MILVALVSVLAFLAAAPCSAGIPNSAAQALLSEVILKTQASKDVYHLLSSSQKTAWSYDDGHTINETIAAVTSVPVELTVDVRLVGFDGDGHSGLNIPPSLLLKYLSALHGELDTVALQPTLRTVLPLAPHVTFRVTHAPTAVREVIDVEVQQNFRDAREHPEKHTMSPMLLIPARAIDALVHDDWTAHQPPVGTPGASFTLYLLNPQGEGKDTRHAYSYEPALPMTASGRAASTAGPESMTGAGCPGSLWSGAQPYAWIDITAGPLVYGPGLGHQGQVLAHSLPRPDMYRIGSANRAIVPDLAALTWSACKHLIWPPIHTSDLQYHESLVVQVIHMHDTLSPPARHLDANVLLQQLRSAAPEVVEVKEAWLSFAQCDLCVAALTAATKMRTARDLSSGGTQSTTRPFLDPLLLHDIMRRYKDRIFAYADLQTMDKSSGQDRQILPVFVFDLSQIDVLLLDDETRATAFSDMVLAVATKRAAPVATHFNCAYSRVMLDGGDITREVLGATLQAGWGVAHTAAYHSRATGENANFLWSVGNTPFGPFSQLPALSATQHQAASRNHVAVMLDGTARRVAEVMQAFAKLCPKGHAECALETEIKTKLRRRLNLYNYKVQQAAARVASWDAQGALPFARSAAHDALALEQLAAWGTLGYIDVKFECQGHVAMWHFFVYPSLSMLAWLAAMSLRLRISRPKLNKQY